ncbi:hypothetical protein CRM22_006427 [Opisthorchis felineus]|uniref:Ketoreductase (KR) domain-containing protein n=1 Tax=Opisthorchis felineus TaxID=147828 RepID=A0A4S2LL28_OPIFE|nr:hypothetical protein CRM22_006427 [Opisthorchis felineus]
MSIYATTIFLPPIAPPRIDLELNDTTYSSDDRLKIAEVEAAFEEFENELSLQVRPVVPGGQISRKYAALRAVGIVSALTSAGLLGYRLFVSIPQYDGPEANMRGKTVLVTEATARPTRDLLRNLAERGAHLILTSADPDACTKARDRILRATNISGSRVDCRQLNLDSTVSIRRFVASLLADYPRIDRAVLQSPSCVTGIVAGKWRPTHEGFEYQLGTNYFSTYLLTRLLWNRLDENGSRLILVVDTDAASEARTEAPHRTAGQVELPINDLNYDKEEKYIPKKVYQRSQWFLELFADELSRRTGNDSGASVFIANPNISRGTAPKSPTVDINKEGLQGLYHTLTDFAARLIKRRTATTALFCAVADPSVLELTGNGEKTHTTDVSQNRPNVRSAPLYQDLRLISSSVQPSKAKDDCRRAASLLWAMKKPWSVLLCGAVEMKSRLQTTFDDLYDDSSLCSGASLC